MAQSLVDYLQDHLAGARFAINLLQDLSGQEREAAVGALAQTLLPEIEEDRAVLEGLVAELGADPSAVKEALAWLTQKASRLKLTASEPAGIFEAVEVLSLGVLGKLALWNTLKALAAAGSSAPGIATLDLEALCARAERQHGALEALRRELAVNAFSGRPAR